MMLNNRVVSVKPIKDFILEITFKDGKSFTLDFRTMVESESGWLLYDALRNPEVFQKVQVNGLTLEWPTGLDFCPDGLRYCCEVGRICSDDEIADIFKAAPILPPHGPSRTPEQHESQISQINADLQKIPGTALP